jgi:methionine sulfoxide reductase heme-binding subunit
MRRSAKPILFALALLPTAYLIYGVWTASLGANPAETIQLQTGRWAFKFLLLTLAITPLRRLTRWNVVIQYRRMLGLFAFYYASLHFASYIVLDQYFDWAAMLADIRKRPFITIGFTAFVLLVPLALTSTRGWIRRLGRKWQTLHRLIYVTAVCAAIHFLWKVKVASGDAVLYAAIVLLLLGFRVVDWLRKRSVRRAQRAVRPRNLPVH